MQNLHSLYKLNMMFVKIVIVSIFFLNALGHGQDSAIPSVRLAVSPVNTVHPFYQVLSKKDTAYMNWLYYHCSGLAHKNILKSPLNSPLVFTIKREKVVVTDTIANCVHPKLYENVRELKWQNEIPLYGSLPKGIDFHISNDPKSLTTIDLFLEQEMSDVNLYVLTAKGEMVATIADKPLTKGNHSLQWNTKNIKAGNYLLFTEIDTYLTIHQIHVEKNWWSNIFSRGKEVTYSKKVYRSSYEAADLPKLEGEFPYIRKNRFGTSLGFNLPNSARIKIKLYAINGNPIASILHQKLDSGEYEFLLDKYVEKSGWYLVQLTINDKQKHLKLNIKK